MATIKLGSNSLLKVYLGSTLLTSIDLGANTGLMAPLLTAPVLLWTSPSSDTTPEFTVDLTAPLAGDKVRIYRAGVLNTEHTLTQPEIDALSFPLGLSAWADGTYAVTATHVRGTAESAASNTQTVTILAVTAHRYWRISASGSTGGPGSGHDGLGLNEVQFRVAGVNQTGSGTALASSSFSGSSPANAFDGNGATTKWDSDFSGAWPQWIGYDFGSGVTKDITAVAIWPNLNLRAPAAFDVQYSDNGSTWTTLWSVTGKVAADYTNSLNVFTKP